MEILITGITGLVGAAFAKKAIEQGHVVRGFCRENANKTNLKEIEDKIIYYEGDILDVLSLERALIGVDWVFHAAAMVSFNPKDRNQMSKINIEGTANIVNLSLTAGIKRFCFVSSVAALGKPPFALMAKDAKTEITENQKWVDESENSHYGFTKFQAECEVWRGISEGLPAFIINPSIILGEGNWSQSSSQLFKYVFNENKFFTGGYLNFIDLKDVIDITFALFNKETEGERFILNADSILLKGFFDKIAIRFGKKTPSIQLNNFQIGVLWRLENLRSMLMGSNPLITKETAHTAKLNMFYSNQKIKNTLNFNFRSLENSLDRICPYYLKQK
jgi:dihydroflavonol-4-reductase